MAELELVADRFVFLHEGVVVRAGTLAEMGSRTTDEEVYVASDELGAALDVLRAAGLRVRLVDAGAVAGSGPARIGRLVFGAGLTLTHLAPHVGSLEDLFLASTAAPRNEEI